MTDILFVQHVGMFSVHLMLGALSVALGQLKLCRIFLSIGVLLF